MYIDEPEAHKLRNFVIILRAEFRQRRYIRADSFRALCVTFIVKKHARCHCQL